MADLKSQMASMVNAVQGKGNHITIDNIGGENIKSTDSEKLLGLQVNSNFEWSTHVEKLSIRHFKGPFMGNLTGTFKGNFAKFLNEIYRTHRIEFYSIGHQWKFCKMVLQGNPKEIL